MNRKIGQLEGQRRKKNRTRYTRMHVLMREIKKYFEIDS